MAAEYPEEEPKIVYYKLEKVLINSLTENETVVVVYYWSDGKVTWTRD